jgi:hypothetical protein
MTWVKAIGQTRRPDRGSGKKEREELPSTDALQPWRHAYMTIVCNPSRQTIVPAGRILRAA